MWLVNLIVAILIIYAGWRGFRRGLVLSTIDLIGLLVAALAASLGYQLLGEVLSDGLRMVPPLANLTAFTVIWLVAEAAYFLAARSLVNRIPERLNQSIINSWLGIIVNIAKQLVLIALFLLIFVGLPVAAGLKTAVTEAAIPRLLLSYSGRWQRIVNQVVNQNLNETLNFFTVKPQSGETVALGYRTTNVHVNAAAEARMLVLVNHERTSRGLSALTINRQAQLVARKHSADMFARGYFSHVDPDGLDPFERMKAGGVEFNAAGENLALAPTLDLAHQGLMNSPGHRANILSPDYHQVGIGIIDGGAYGLMVTQNFTD